MRLNAGCWQQRLDGYLNMDLFGTGAEVLGDLRAMPFRDGCCEEVLLSHVLEHIPHDGVVDALVEVHRILQLGGVAHIIGPDYDRAEASFLAGEIDTDFRPLIWGHGNKVIDHTGTWVTTYDGQSSENHPGADHLWCATGAETMEMVQSVFLDADYVPSSDDRWQFAICAIK